MIRKIILENYMSHARTVIEPAVNESGGGLTVLVGPNNCGKSAVVSALQTLAYNASGDYMVRHGEKETKVTVETDDGHVLVWRRSRDSVSYQIDGRQVHRVGRGVPDDLHDLLRLPEVKSAEEGGEEFDVHFGKQKEPIFLLDSSERKAAVFFASSSDAALLMQMQEKHREKTKERERDKRTLEAHLEKVNESLEVLVPANDLSSRLEAVEEEHEKLIGLEKAALLLAEDLKSLESQARQSSAQGLRVKALTPLKRPPELKETASLERLLERLEEIGDESARESAKLEALSLLAEPPKIEPTTSLETLLRGWEKAFADLKDQESQLKDLERQLVETKDLILEWARANPACPTCGMEINADRLLYLGHAHG